jgi:hypothetical protein
MGNGTTPSVQNCKYCFVPIPKLIKRLISDEKDDLLAAHLHYSRREDFLMHFDDFITPGLFFNYLSKRILVFFEKSNSRSAFDEVLFLEALLDLKSSLLDLVHYQREIFSLTSKKGKELLRRVDALLYKFEKQ